MAPGRHPYGRPKVMTHLPRKKNAPAAAILHRRASLKHKTNNDDIIPKQFAKQCLKPNNEYFSIALFNFALVSFLCKAR